MKSPVKCKCGGALELMPSIRDRPGDMILVCLSCHTQSGNAKPYEDWIAAFDVITGKVKP